jgi:hypothetical protein
MVKKKTENAEVVQLKPIKIKRIEVKVVGDSSLIVHKWGEKAIRMILEHHTKRASGGREIRTPEQEYVDTLYWLKGEPEDLTIDTFKQAVKNGAQFAFPSTAFKQAALSGGYRAGMIKDKVSIKGHFHIDDEMVRIVGVPEMRMDMVRLSGMGNPADIRFRAEFKEWSATIPIRYNEAVISAEQIVNLFNVAGFSVGIGEWRVERDGNHGMYHVVA